MAPFEPEGRGPAQTMPEVPPPQYTDATYGDDGYPGFALPTGQCPARTSILMIKAHITLCVFRIAVGQKMQSSSISFFYCHDNYI